MRPELEKIARDNGLYKEYSLIRVKDGTVVNVADKIDPTLERLLEAAFQAGMDAAK